MEEMQNVLEDIEIEGFDYAMVHYSNYEDVENKDFHDLRLEFLTARKALMDFLSQFGEIDE